MLFFKRHIPFFFAKETIFSVFLLLCIPFLGFSQQEKNPLQDTVLFDTQAFIENFVEDLANDSIALDVILSQKVALSENLDDEMLDYLLASLQEIRFNLKWKDKEKIKITPYLSLPRKAQEPIDFDGYSPEDVFFVQHNERTVFSILLGKEKIASFTLVSKGNNRRHFITY